MLQPRDYEWKVPEATKSRDVSRVKETKKVDEDGGHSQCRRGRRCRQHSRGFPPSRGKSPLYQHDQGGRLPSLLEAGGTRIRKIDKKWSDQHCGRIWQGYSEHVVGSKGEQADYIERSGSSGGFGEHSQFKVQGLAIKMKW